MIRRFLDLVMTERNIVVEKTTKVVRYIIPMHDDVIGDTVKLKIENNSIVLTFYNNSATERMKVSQGNKNMEEENDSK